MDILGAVYDFLVTLFPDGLACSDGRVAPIAEVIVRANQNRVSLPPYPETIILTLLSSRRVGTNVHRHTYQEEGDIFTENINMLTEYAVQVDFYGEYQDEVMQRANKLAIVARDAYACDFFRPYGTLPLYAEDVRDLTIVDEQRQWNPRYSIILRFEAWEKVGIERDYFTSVNIEFEDVDVHHPVTDD